MNTNYFLEYKKLEVIKIPVLNPLPVFADHVAGNSRIEIE